MLFTVRSRPAYSTPKPATASRINTRSTTKIRFNILFIENASFRCVL